MGLADAFAEENFAEILEDLNGAGHLSANGPDYWKMLDANLAGGIEAASAVELLSMEDYAGILANALHNELQRADRLQRNADEIE